MRVEPKLDEVVYGKRGVLRGIEVVLREQCLVSAVALMFAAIDSLAALTRPISVLDTDKPVFLAWVDDYLRPTDRLGCTSADLYAARVLHTYTPDSSLQRGGLARRLVYEWRQGPDADAATLLPSDALVIQVEELHDSLQEAVRLFLIKAETDESTRERVQYHLRSMLCYTPWSRLESTVAA